jgi:hypothetical protein
VLHHANEKVDQTFIGLLVTNGDRVAGPRQEFNDE